MESSILSEVDDTSILRPGLPTPLCLSSQLATGLSPLAPAQRAGAQRLCALALKRPTAAPAEGLLTEAVLKHYVRCAEPPPMTQFRHLGRRCGNPRANPQSH